MHPETKKVEVRKGLMKRDDFIAAYQSDAGKYADSSPFLVHMRIISAGDGGPKNTHPHRIKGGALIHNGTLFYPNGKHAGKADDRKSDTRVFANVLHNILDLQSVRIAEKAILNEVGANNKLVFLYDNKEYFIMNESSGIWEDDIWYSNSYSCEVGDWYRNKNKKG